MSSVIKEMKLDTRSKGKINANPVVRDAPKVIV
jgi:hypothetical protein